MTWAFVMVMPSPMVIVPSVSGLESAAGDGAGAACEKDVARFTSWGASGGGDDSGGLSTGLSDHGEWLLVDGAGVPAFVRLAADVVPISRGWAVVLAMMVPLLKRFGRVPKPEMDWPLLTDKKAKADVMNDPPAIARVPLPLRETLLVKEMFWEEANVMFPLLVIVPARETLALEAREKAPAIVTLEKDWDPVAMRSPLTVRLERVVMPRRLMRAAASVRI